MCYLRVNTARDGTPILLQDLQFTGGLRGDIVDKYSLLNDNGEANSKGVAATLAQKTPSFGLYLNHGFLPPLNVGDSAAAHAQHRLVPSANRGDGDVIAKSDCGEVFSLTGRIAPPKTKVVYSGVRCQISSRSGVSKRNGHPRTDKEGSSIAGMCSLRLRSAVHPFFSRLHIHSFAMIHRLCLSVPIIKVGVWTIIGGRANGPARKGDDHNDRTGLHGLFYIPISLCSNLE
ncbi:hypothetical protein R3P38DRAFT_3379782, partial [Favolaschia claudopus]